LLYLDSTTRWLHNSMLVGCKTSVLSVLFHQKAQFELTLKSCGEMQTTFSERSILSQHLHYCKFDRT
jgi:hypothetical protein